MPLDPTSSNLGSRRAEAQMCAQERLWRVEPVRVSFLLTLAELAVPVDLTHLGCLAHGKQSRSSACVATLH